MKRIFVPVLTIIFTLFLIVTPALAGVTSLSSNLSSGISACVNIYVGSSTEFRADGTDSTGNKTNETENAVWSSSNPNVATVVNGKVTGVSPGLATIEATYDGKTATSQVYVKFPPNFGGGSTNTNTNPTPTPAIIPITVPTPTVVTTPTPTPTMITPTPVIVKLLPPVPTPTQIPTPTPTPTKTITPTTEPKSVSSTPATIPKIVQSQPQIIETKPEIIEVPQPQPQTKTEIFYIYVPQPQQPQTQTQSQPQKQPTDWFTIGLYSLLSMCLGGMLVIIGSILGEKKGGRV
jgi:hypothetical protein